MAEVSQRLWDLVPHYPARRSWPSCGFELQSVPDWQILFSPGWLSHRLPAEGGPGQAQSGLCSVNRHLRIELNPV